VAGSSADMTPSEGGIHLLDKRIKMSGDVSPEC